MRRRLLLAALSIALLFVAVSAFAEIERVASGEAVAATPAPAPYRAGPLATRAAAEPSELFAGAGEGAALVTLLALGLGLRWADRAGASRRRSPARGFVAGIHGARGQTSAR